MFLIFLKVYTNFISCLLSLIFINLITFCNYKKCIAGKDCELFRVSYLVNKKILPYLILSPYDSLFSLNNQFINFSITLCNCVYIQFIKFKKKITKLKVNN